MSKKERILNTTNNLKEITPLGRVERFVKWLKRRMEYLFKRRLAITPYRALNDGDNKCDKMLFEWQKMPGGYRWF